MSEFKNKTTYRQFQQYTHLPWSWWNLAKSVKKKIDLLWGTVSLVRNVKKIVVIIVYAWYNAFRICYILKRENSVKRHSSSKQNSVTERDKSKGKTSPWKEEVKSDPSSGKCDGELFCYNSPGKFWFNCKFREKQRSLFNMPWCWCHSLILKKNFFLCEMISARAFYTHTHQKALGLISCSLFLSTVTRCAQHQQIFIQFLGL